VAFGSLTDSILAAGVAACCLQVSHVIHGNEVPRLGYSSMTTHYHCHVHLLTGVRFQMKHVE
jgi:hypothetical protein